MSKKDAPHPYDDYHYYGPVFNKREGRNSIFLINKNDGSRTTVSYARFLYQTHHKIKLDKTQHIDHIDGNKENDVIENLQILNFNDNYSKMLIDRKRTKKIVELKCPNCGKIFFKRRGHTHLQNGGSYTSCSKVCSWNILSMVNTNKPFDFSGNVIRVFEVPVKDTSYES